MNAVAPVDLKPPAGDTNDPLRLSAFDRLGEWIDIRDRCDFSYLKSQCQIRKFHTNFGKWALVKRKAKIGTGPTDPPR